MRLLLLNHNLREHGTYFRAFDVARELVRRGHEAVLLTASPGHWFRPAEETVRGVRVVETPSWNWRLGGPGVLSPDDGWGPLDVAYRLGRALAEPFDVLYAFAHPPNVYLPARLARAVRRKPVVVDWCDVYRDGIFPLREEIRAYQDARGWRIALQRRAEAIEKRLERDILRWADGVTVISDYLREEALAQGVPEERILRFPSGANIEVIAPRDKSACRQSFGVEGQGPFVGYVANYNPDERFFLTALARAFERHPNARLIAACPPFTESLVRENGLADRIVRFDRMPFERIPEVLGAADVLALPLDDNVSNQGRWPNKFGDYLAAGRPIAACAVGDTAEYFPDPQRMHAWLANPGQEWPEAPAGVAGGGEAALDAAGAEPSAPLPIGIAGPCQPEEYGDAMADILAKPQKWLAMGAAARHTAELRLSWSAIGDLLEPFLARFARNPKAQRGRN